MFVRLVGRSNWRFWMSLWIKEHITTSTVGSHKYLLLTIFFKTKFNYTFNFIIQISYNLMFNSAWLSCIRHFWFNRKKKTEKRNIQSKFRLIENVSFVLNLLWFQLAYDSEIINIFSFWWACIVSLAQNWCTVSNTFDVFISLIAFSTCCNFLIL